jgi:hypothetical protein
VPVKKMFDLRDSHGRTYLSLCWNGENYRSGKVYFRGSGYYGAQRQVASGSVDADQFLNACKWFLENANRPQDQGFCVGTPAMVIREDINEDINEDKLKLIQGILNIGKEE